MNTIASYWSSLNERERWTLGLGVAVCALYLIYLLILSPLWNAVHNKTQELQEKRELVAWMQQVSPKSSRQKAPQKLTSSQLLTLLAEQLNTSAIKAFPYQLQQTGVNETQLVFERVPYNLFIEWLWSFSQKFAISVKQLNVEHSETPGVVKLMITLVNVN